MRWPGAVYDGEAARQRYARDITRVASDLKIRLDLRDEPLYSLEEAQAWISQAQADGVDGLFLVTLDRQQHAWPSAQLLPDSGIPSVVFSPLGTSFTTNTAPLCDKPGCVVYTSVGEFDQAAYGMKMLQAAAKMRRCRCAVIKGDREFDTPLADTGITLRYVPAQTFIEQYRGISENDEVKALAQEYLRRARHRHGAAKQDVLNGVRSYFAAARILERTEADAISMDCLGALGKIDVSLPCIAWSRMNDDGIPAGCEADTAAVASHVMVQYLFDRPGFQQDPVPDTTDDTVIGAHCSCPTRLNGFGSRPEPFDLLHHHGNRDAVPRPLWRTGQRVTSLDVMPAGDSNPRTQLLISTGTVVENLNVPPAGGCVVSVKVKFDGDQPVLSFPGFHQVFFYGDYKRELRDFCQLCNFEAVVA